MASRDASRLQQDGDIPICGLYRNVESDRLVRFKPYSLESGISLDAQLTTIAASLTERLAN